jgi:tetratricopeptide (TPR) repeat protein
MGMSGQYGRSFSSKLIQDGKYEEAILAAGKAIAQEDDEPEHYVDRATALVLLERNVEAVEDFVRALQLDASANILESDLIDDAYFSALLATARQEAGSDLEAGCKRLTTYLEVLPEGRHVEDVRTWTLRLRGQLKSEFVKVRD